MLKLNSLSCSLLILFLFTSCSSISEVSNFRNQEVETVKVKETSHVNAYIWGFYLFGFYPIVAGSAEYPGSVVFFKDTASPDAAVQMLTAKAKQNGADATTNISTETTATGAFSLWIVYLCDAQASGNAIKI